jgi:hypothetical protein
LVASAWARECHGFFERDEKLCRPEMAVEAAIEKGRSRLDRDQVNVERMVDNWSAAAAIKLS